MVHAPSSASGLLVRRWSSPAPSPARILRHAREDDLPFALISGRGDPALSCWSYAALEPIGAATSIERAHRQIASWIDSFDPSLPPFPGGAVGYAGYDLGFALVARPRVPRPDPLGMAASKFLLYDAVYARNESTGEGFLLAQPDAGARMERLAAALEDEGPPVAGRSGLLSPRISKHTHLARIRRALELIAAGEIYQVNLTYPLAGRFEGDPRAAFLRLLAAPPTFAAYLRIDRDQHLISASPECFFDLSAASRMIAAYPIKGTRRRSPDPILDRALSSELMRDEKERAEHLMIVDLLRNDVGRIAELGSVCVDGLAYVESFPGVHHLTSRVLGRIRGDVDLAKVLRAMFPGGSITGAPKLRAMEVIDALEDSARGVYTGAIGYVTPGGSVRTSIAIRTAQIREGELLFGVGGGIVADSSPEREWEETVVKSESLRRALDG
jgi:para-aminobenzoate synthetase component 1